MKHRYLFGPVTSHVGDQRLARARTRGECLTFGPAAGVDLVVGPSDTWASVSGRLPPDWKPEFIALMFPGACAPPEWVWDAPLPVVAVVTGWSLLWHYYRRWLRQCDLILTDAAGAETLAREGLPQARAANVCGCDRSLAERPVPSAPRDLDIVYVSNLPRAATAEHGPWLLRLARLGLRWRVAVCTGVYGAQYVGLLRRARVVVNRSLHGEANVRVFDAAAAGALLFQEAGNREVPSCFQDRRECVLYDDAGLERLLDHYLEHEEERSRLAQAARGRVGLYTFEAQWDEQLVRIEADWPALAQAAARRPATDRVPGLLARCWQLVTHGPHSDPTLAAELQRVEGRPRAVAAVHNALGVLAAHTGPDKSSGRAPVEVAVAQFRRSIDLDPGQVIARLNLAEALVALGQPRAAVSQARAALERLEHPDGLHPLVWESPFHAPSYDTFRAEWERAAWANAGDVAAEVRAKQGLLRWRLQSLLARETGDLTHGYEAVLHRPDLLASRAALGSALARGQRTGEAASHLRQAVAADPLDFQAARNLFHVLGVLGQTEEQQRLAQDCCLLSLAAPQLCPEASWFAGALAVPARRERRPAPVDGPGEPSLALEPSSRKRVSLTMIVKNEEAHLPQCLSTVADLVDEIVIADTGSTDRTKEVATRFGARVVEFPWCDDFGAARNASLSQARGHWVWWLDADDWLDEANRQRARALFAGLGNEKDAYVMRVRSALNAAGTSARMLEQVRLFPNHPETRWQYRIHEQIMPAVRQRGGDVRWSDVVIEHSGYQNPALRRKKLERNIRLLEMEYRDNPDDPYTLFNLGWTSFDLRRTEEAARHLRRSLELAAPTASIVRKLYVLLVQASRRLHDTEQAVRYCRDGTERFPNDPELLFEEAVLLRAEGDLPGAEDRLRRLQRAPAERCLSSVDAGLRGHKTFHLLGDICRAQGRLAEAETHWRTALAERPDFGPALLALGRLCVEQQRWREVEQLARELDKEPAGQVDAAVLRARAHKARGEFAQARSVLAPACAREPEALEPRVLLSHVLLQEGKDWAEAEKLLREILTLAPRHAEARRNLTILVREHGSTMQPEPVP